MRYIIIAYEIFLFMIEYISVCMKKIIESFLLIIRGTMYHIIVLLLSGSIAEEQVNQAINSVIYKKYMNEMEVLIIGIIVPAVIAIAIYYICDIISILIKKNEQFNGLFNHQNTIISILMSIVSVEAVIGINIIKINFLNEYMLTYALPIIFIYALLMINLYKECFLKYKIAYNMIENIKYILNK
ncbi:MAG: hypothetical protein UDG94_01920 [Peptococcaceae bacterium]|nr:hypothetical protein [Peptococcaceae bacterium]